MTLNIYSQVLPSMQVDAADAMDELIPPIEVGEELNKLKEVTQQYGG